MESIRREWRFGKAIVLSSTHSGASISVAVTTGEKSKNLWERGVPHFPSSDFKWL